MTGYTVHTGSTVKFSQGWDHIFGGAKPVGKKPGGNTRAGKSAAKKAASARRAKRRA
jgi:hypothetical protein